MRARLFRSRRSAGIAAVVGLLVSMAALPAQAAGPSPICLSPAGQDLYDVGPVLKWSLNTYRVTTTESYWSVVSVRGSQGYNPDLVLRDQAHCVLASSENGSATRVDWIAFDNNTGRLPLGAYPARVYGHPGNTSPVKYLAQFVKGKWPLSTTTTYFQQVGTAYPDWQVDIRDVQLIAGKKYGFTVNGGVNSVHLVGSTSDPASWAKSAATADHTLDFGVDLPGDVPQFGMLEVTAPRTGWYGLVFVRDATWEVPAYVHISVS